MADRLRKEKEKLLEPSNLPVPVGEDEEEDFEIKNEITAQIAALPDDLKKILKRLSYLTAKVGLPLEEACVMSDITKEWLEEKIKLRPIIAHILRKKEIEYKKELLSVVSKSGRTGNEKTATWLLSTRFPDEYGKQKRGAPDDDDALGTAIAYVRQTQTPDGLVSKEAGKAFLVKKGDKLRQEVQEFLK